MSMTEEEIEREVLDAWLRVANDNVAIWRIINDCRKYYLYL